MGQEHAPPLSYLERTKATKRARNRIVAIQAQLQSRQDGRARADYGRADVGGIPVAQGRGQDASASSPPGRQDPCADPRVGTSGRPDGPPSARSTASRSGKCALPTEALREELVRLRRSINDREMSRVTTVARRAKRPRETGGEARPQGDGERSIDGDPASQTAGSLALDWRRGLWGEPREQAGSRPLPAFSDPMLARAADMFRVPGLAHFMSCQVERQAVFQGFDELLSRRDRAFDGLPLADALCDCEIDMSVAQQLMDGETELASALLAAVAADPERA